VRSVNFDSGGRLMHPGICVDSAIGNTVSVGRSFRQSFAECGGVCPLLTDTSMTALPSAARIYVLTVVTLGGLSVSWTLANLSWSAPAHFLALLLLACVASVFKFTVPLPRRLEHTPLTMSLSFAVNFAALLLLGGENAAVVAITAAWTQSTFNTRTRNPWFRVLFNMGALALTMRATAIVFVGLGGTYGASSIPKEAVAVAGAAATYYLLNSAFIAGAVALTTHHPFTRLWVTNFIQGWISHLFGTGLAALGAIGLGHTLYWVAPLVVVTLALAYRTYRSYIDRIDEQQRAVQNLSDLHLATVEALALAIDAKDQGSRLHLRRMQRYGSLLARASGLDDAAVQAVETAAMLHDIGMLAVPQHILAKSGPLTAEEQRKLSVHPQVGADVVRTVPFPSPVAPLILSHHERWDGRGYPAGLSGEQIPLGARIIALVDCFDALLQGDPPLTVDEAAERIVQDAGHAFDPLLVERFCGLLPEIARCEHELTTAPELDGRLEAEASAAHLRANGPLEHIALAHREVSELYELSQALGATLAVGDAMEQLTARLPGLVPFTTCALYIREEHTNRTLYRAIGGSESERLSAVATEFVDGPVAWVMANDRSLVTTLPSVSRQSGSAPLASSPGHVEALVCPLRAEGQVLGALALFHDRRDSYADDQRRILEQVCDILGSAIQNSLRYERTHEAALTDRLTGLPNSRGLAAWCARALARASYEQDDLAVLMIDLNAFKDVNDTYGHGVGDKALKEVGRVLFHAIRPSDLCTRYAGDEFIVVLANCDRAQAERRAEELRRDVAAVRFAPRPGVVIPLRISIGAAVFPDDGWTLDELLIVADRRMYSDKMPGKRASERRLGVIAPSEAGSDPLAADEPGIAVAESSASKSDVPVPIS
jgi:diguanylate cyclase (GGDEF)-like protein